MYELKKLNYNVNITTFCLCCVLILLNFVMGVFIVILHQMPIFAL